MADTDREAFDKRGWHIVRGFFDKDEVTHLLSLARELEDAEEGMGRWMKYYEPHSESGNPILSRVENYMDYWPRAQDVLCGKRVKDHIESVTGERYILFKEKINFKFPGCSGFQPHQDAPAWARFVSGEAITAFSPIDDSTLENGPLEVDTNFSYGRSILDHADGRVVHNERIIEPEYSAICCAPGDLVLFSSYLLHRSSPNKSNTARRAFLTTFSPEPEGSVRSEYFEFKRSKFPPISERKDMDQYSNWRGRLAGKIL